MQLIVFLGLLVGTALTASTNHANITVYTLSDVRDDLNRYGQFPQPPVLRPVLNDLRTHPFTFVHPYGGKVLVEYVPDGLIGLSRYPELVQHLQQGHKYVVVGYPWQLPREIIDGIPGLDVIASASHGNIGIAQLPQLAAELYSRPIVLLQGRNEEQLVREEQLREVGTIQVTHDGNVQIVRDVVVEHLQDPKYGAAFFNPYGFAFQGYNTAYPFNYGYQLPYNGFQGQYPGYGYQGLYPGSTFQPHYPYYGFPAQYPFYGFQGQYPNYGHQGQYYNYGPAGKASPTYPGYNCYQGYNGLYPGYGGPYLYPGILGNPFGYNLIPTPYYPGHHPFSLYGSRNQQNQQQEEAAKGYSGYQYGLYPPFTLYAQQPQYQYGSQYQAYPTNYQSYPYPQPEPRSYQYAPYQFQEYQSYQYQPYQFQQYQPYYPQYHPFQNYQAYYGQHYPQ